MIKTELFTRAGEYVVTVMIPPFTPPAEAIVWGSRFFFRREDKKYYEGLAFYVTEMLEVPVRCPSRCKVGKGLLEEKTLQCDRERGHSRQHSFGSLCWHSDYEIKDSEGS